VRDRLAVDAAVAATVREFGRLDVLLDCAGVSGGASFLDFEHSEWERIIAVNLTGMFHLGQAAARQMVRQEAKAASSMSPRSSPRSRVPGAPPTSRRKAAAAR
jgi:glucose 1-dehydrogenase